ncbi:RES domain-containing protein [Actinokineospora cianjurensis]|uniref:RES domain-containing protein n=1 Tax=Actinokineospora cianjurensis TaxID=585224 RepID=UPI0014772A14|nr:HEPN-associated N-terminal domain-containing protein [Actinokineospora cianjurensis]
MLDPGLREQLRQHLSEHDCFFCGNRADPGAAAIAVGFDHLMTEVMAAVRFLFSTPDDAGMPWDGEAQAYAGAPIRRRDEVAERVCRGDVTDTVLEAIAAAIADDAWTAYSHHGGPNRPDEMLTWAWGRLCDQVKHRSRFVFLLPRPDAPHPESEFEDCGDLTAARLLRHLERIIDEHGLRRVVPAGQRFWRGRLADNPADLIRFATAAELGSPPPREASSNRFSPAGIPMFYGSDDPDTALAEIRTHDNSKPHAVIGAFDTVRDLLLLDLVDLPAQPSLYTETGRTGSWFDLRFLRDFVADLTTPVILDQRIHIDYVPTQVVTEYLRLAAATPVHGIRYRSARNGAVNLVLFCEQSHCVDNDTSPPHAQQEPMLRFVAGSARLHEATHPARTEPGKP